MLDGILYAVGGHDGPVVRKSVEAFNPETQTWSPVAEMTLCRRNAGKTSIPPVAAMLNSCHSRPLGLNALKGIWRCAK